MTENYEERPLTAPMNGERPFPPMQPPLAQPIKGDPEPKLSFPEQMSELGKKFSFSSFMECEDLPGYKNITAGVGVNLPFPSKTTKVTAGIEARASVFNTPEGAQMTKGVLPSLRVTQDLGKNTQLMARISPSSREYAKIGVQFNF